MNHRTSRRHNSIAIQSNDDLPATVLTYYNPVGSPPASPLQLDDDAETAQPHPDLADLAATAAEPLPTPGLASQPVQILPQLRSPALSPTDVTSVTISESFDYETDMDVEPGAADEDDMWRRTEDAFAAEPDFLAWPLRLVLAAATP